LGKSLVDCGDINGDGVDDIMFGSWDYDMNSQGCLDIWKGDRAFVVHVPEEAIPIPQNFRLLPPYPNPFNSSLTIPFEILSGHVSDISLRIYNILGQEVIDLSREVSKALSGRMTGHYEVGWNGKNQTGNDAGSGIYLMELRYGTTKQIQKAVLLR